MKNRLVLICALFVFFSNAYSSEECDFNSISGKEFTFREKPLLLQKFGYQDWKVEPSSVGNRLGYERYVGKKGRLQEQQVTEGKYSSFYVAILETCEKVYTRGATESWPRALADIEGSGDIFYLDTLHQVEALIGKKVWLNMNGVTRVKNLYTDDSHKVYPLLHLEYLEIVGVHTKPIAGDFNNGRPFMLIVKKQTGESGYIAFDERFYDQQFFSEDPINPKWGKKVIDLIKSRKIKIGMLEQQVLLSWGKPEKINKSVGVYGVHEQWVYGHGQYVYMENKELTSFQSSQ